jgi:hypothetical protein
MKLAVCLFGESVECGYEEYIKNVIGMDNLYIFHVPNNDLLKSLWLTADKKRQYEICSNLDFDICLGLRTNELNILEYINVDKVKVSCGQNVFYYPKGYFYNNCTSIHLNGFYSSSFIFDRVSEFLFADIDASFLNVKTLGSIFYYYLKYINIKLECVNYENSSLFKRTT